MRWIDRVKSTIGNRLSECSRQVEMAGNYTNTNVDNFTWNETSEKKNNNLEILLRDEVKF